TPQYRRQGRPFRAQGPGRRGFSRRVGVQVRRHGQEVQRSPEGVAGAGGFHWKHL
ncbi:hypothetical protein KEM55_001638, partial [Ascosphaera atra]